MIASLKERGMESDPMDNESAASCSQGQLPLKGKHTHTHTPQTHNLHRTGTREGVSVVVCVGESEPANIAAACVWNTNRAALPPRHPRFLTSRDRPERHQRPTNPLPHTYDNSFLRKENWLRKEKDLAAARMWRRLSLGDGLPSDCKERMEGPGDARNNSKKEAAASCAVHTISQKTACPPPPQGAQKAPQVTSTPASARHQQHAAVRAGCPAPEAPGPGRAPEVCHHPTLPRNPRRPAPQPPWCHCQLPSARTCPACDAHELKALASLTGGPVQWGGGVGHGCLQGRKARRDSQTKNHAPALAAVQRRGTRHAPAGPLAQPMPVSGTPDTHTHHKRSLHRLHQMRAGTRPHPHLVSLLQWLHPVKHTRQRTGQAFWGNKKKKGGGNTKNGTP
jgi:hypothetical protein